MTEAIVLLSGGLDSAVCLALASRVHTRVLALAFDYGQRHVAELRMAAWQAAAFGAELRVVGLPTITKGSALVGDGDPRRDGTGVLNTYVPARNTQFLAIALSLAEQEQASHVYIGVNSLDYSGYPDCRPEYIEAMRRVYELGVASNPPMLSTPLIHLTKAEIIDLGVFLHVDFSHTSSCYDPVSTPSSVFACGRCDSCMIRRAGFEKAGIPDTTTYAKQALIDP